MKWSEVVNKQIILRIFRKKSGTHLSEDRVARTVRLMKEGELVSLDKLITKMLIKDREEKVVYDICQNIDNSSN